MFLNPRSLCQIGDDEMKWIKKKKLTVSCKRDEEIIVELCPKKCVMLLAGSPNRDDGSFSKPISSSPNQRLN